MAATASVSEGTMLTTRRTGPRSGTGRPSSSTTTRATLPPAGPSGSPRSTPYTVSATVMTASPPTRNSAFRCGIAAAASTTGIATVGHGHAPRHVRCVPPRINPVPSRYRASPAATVQPPSDGRASNGCATRSSIPTPAMTIPAESGRWP